MIDTEDSLRYGPNHFRSVRSASFPSATVLVFQLPMQNAIKLPFGQVKLASLLTGAGEIAFELFCALVVRTCGTQWFEIAGRNHAVVLLHSSRGRLYAA